MHAMHEWPTDHHPLLSISVLGRMDDICRAISHLDADVSYADVEHALGPYFLPRKDGDDDSCHEGRNDDENNDTNDNHTAVSTVASIPKNGKDDDEEGDESFRSLCDCLHRRRNKRNILTPLLLATDRAQVNTVRYLLSSPQYPQLTGRVTADLAPTSDNTVLHHVAMSNTPTLLKVLWENHDRNNNDCNCTSCNRYHWHTLANTHGDTPLMMAATYNCDQLLQYWLSLLQKQETTDKHRDDPPPSDAFGLGRRNASGDSAISLAASHGNIAALKVILQYAPSTAVVVQTEDWNRAQAAGQKTQQFLGQLQRQQQQQQQQNTPSHQQQELRNMIDTTQTKHNQIKECLEIIQTVLQQRADTLAAELMAKEEHGVVPKETTTPSSKQQQQLKKKPKSKSKKINPQRRRQAKRDSNSTDYNTSAGKEQEMPSATDGEDLDLVRFTKLDNGTRAVVVPGRTLAEDSGTHTESAVHEQPLDEKMFQHQINILTTTTNENNHNHKDGEEEDRYEDITLRMQALGLLDHHHDQNPQQWLLLTAHGMALHLSPSQLDAVEWILQRQLQHTVPQARAIQQRLHNTGRQPPQSPRSSNP
eukprot:scaffold3424_cov182-Amphora_coffeaeformis.AAC.2